MRADRRLAAVVAAAGLLALAVGIGAAVAHTEPRMAGSNLLPFHGQIELPAGATICHSGELVFADAARLRVYAPGGPPYPPLAAEIVHQGRTLAAGRTPGGWVDATAEIPLRPALERTMVADSVCVRNLGEEAVRLGGQTLPEPADSVAIDGEPVAGQLRLEFLRAGDESWLDLLPAVVHRAGLGKGDAAGAWTLPVAGLLLLAACALSVRLAVRGDLR